MAKVNSVVPVEFHSILAISVSPGKTSMMVNDKPFLIDREKLHVLYGSTKVILDRTPGKSKG